jgi:hypothetical protein
MLSPKHYEMTSTLNPFKKSGQQVTMNHVNVLVGNYKSQRWLENSKKLGKADALSTWYGLTELQEFLDLAKAHRADGIKMFYGVYPLEYPNEMLAGRQTVVLVATKKTANNPRASNKAIMVSKDGKKEILAFNYGEICPPFCGGIPPAYEKNIAMELSNIGQLFINKGDNLEII